MKTTCASSLAYGKEAFATLGEVDVLEGRTMTASDLATTDILAIRSTTKVTPDLLEGAPVRFVGTATIGIDHLDTAYLERRGIPWTAAPGSNANSVGEYVAAALLALACRHDLTLQGRTVGIIGVGHVGSQVARKARALGMKVLLNDPPRARASGNDRPGLELGPFTGLEEVLERADIVTLHVPLTESGPDATVQMANSTFFDRMKSGSIFINAARGGIMNSEALLQAVISGRIAHTIIDTWEQEPGIRTDLPARVDIGTPHIAGYSFDGKVNGTAMIYAAACAALDITPSWHAADELPRPTVPRIALEAAGRRDEAVLHAVVRQVYDIESDAALLCDKIAETPQDVAAIFDQLRGNYPVRREFPHTTVVIPDASPGLKAKVRDLGFHLGAS